jgi:hypothetical protein
MLLPDKIAPEVPPAPRAATELIKRIRKLRWIGMDEEADLLQLQLESCGAAPVVVAAPKDTD